MKELQILRVSTYAILPVVAILALVLGLSLIEYGKQVRELNAERECYLPQMVEWHSKLDAALQREQVLQKELVRVRKGGWE